MGGASIPGGGWRPDHCAENTEEGRKGEGEGEGEVEGEGEGEGGRKCHTHTVLPPQYVHMIWRGTKTTAQGSNAPKKCCSGEENSTPQIPVEK